MTQPKDKLSKIIHNLTEEVADQFGGDIDVRPQRSLERKATTATIDLFIEIAKNLHKNSESASAQHECSQEGYEYGLEDFIKELNHLRGEV